MTNPIQLIANDLEDLCVVSSLCQDAIIPASDMTFLRDERSFALVLNRFCWEKQTESPPHYRTHSGLRFDHVTSVSTKGLSGVSPEKILSLLSISYADPFVVLSFSGDAAVKLEVEPLAAALRDLGNPWPTQWRPEHRPPAG